MRSGARTVKAKLVSKSLSQRVSSIWIRSVTLKPSHPAMVLHGAKDTSDEHTAEPTSKKPDNTGKKKTQQAYCPYRESEEHFLSQCDTF